MEMLVFLIHFSSALVRLALVKAGLIPQLMTTLNPLSLSFDEAVDIHTDLMSNIIGTVWLATPDGLTRLEIEDRNEQQAIHETVLKQIVVPSEKYISHLCLNRFSIVDRRQSDNLMDLLTKFLRISPYYQPTLDFVLRMPVILTIPSCLTFFENDYTIWSFLDEMVDVQREWNKTRGENQRMWKTVNLMLRMEGIEDAKEAKLPNGRNTMSGLYIVDTLIELLNYHGLNIQRIW